MTLALSREHRRSLENTIAQARAEAEAGAGKALQALAVGLREVPSHFSEAQKKLRIRLRAHGRALGDNFLPSPSGRVAGGEGTQTTDHLISEIAYEHWHRMLFARFLAESDLLMHPDGYPVSLQDCKTDAASFEPPARSEWEVAGHYASSMLPNVFRPDSPALALQLPLETEQALEALLARLPAAVFQADDSLGWSYQFWQAPKKAEVQRQMKQAGTKVGADELPAVTQLFTEHYMVSFLLENTLGAWWHSRHPGKPLPLAMPYLRTLPSPSGITSDLAGVFCPPSRLVRGSIRGAGGEGRAERGGEAEGTHFHPSHNIPPEHIAFARELRANQTDAENLIWLLVRNRRLADAKFRRQHSLGHYVLDFYCHERKLAIELDGGQHNEAEGQARDAKRDVWLANQGIRVLRFWNNQVLQETEAVLQGVWEALQDDAALTPTPLPEGEWLIPAAGGFPAWPDRLADFKLLDPCAGSGHFLVAAFHYLVPLRQATEELSAREAVDRVLAENLHGLELDARCVEIAAFALALAAWRYPDTLPSPPGRGDGGEGLGEREQPRQLGYRPLPRLNIACVGLAPHSRKADWLQLAGGDTHLEAGMAALYALFQKAPELGSLIDPQAFLPSPPGITCDLAGVFCPPSRLVRGSIRGAWGEGTAGEGAGAESNAAATEARVAAQGMELATRILTRRYHLVITNPPYLGAGQHGPVLKDFCEEHYKTAKGDLANVFLERSLRLCTPGGAVSFVMPQNWLFLGSYKKQREHLLRYETWNLLARLGSGAFETITGEVVNAILLTLTHARPAESQILRGIDASAPKTPEEKAAILARGAVVEVSQADQLRNPDYRVLLEASSGIALLGSLAGGVHGLGTKDSLMFIRNYWEVAALAPDWEFMQSATRTGEIWSGMESIVFWQQGAGVLHERAKVGMAILAGGMAHEKPGVLISQVGTLSACLYSRGLFEKNAAVISLDSEELLPAVWSYCTSEQYRLAVRAIDKKVAVTNTTLVKVPFDLVYWQQVAAERYPDDLPQPYSDDPTQWIFHGHPRPCALTPGPSDKAPTLRYPTGRGGSDSLQVAVARLLGYRWPAESTLSPGPSLTPGHSPGGRGEKGMELSHEARTWIERCQELDDLSDDDGIVCLPAVRGEAAAVDRLRALLARAFGPEWSAAREAQLLQDAGCAGMPLAQWLRDKFFEQHVARFQKRPFIWHVWDGHKEGFSALVNYHLLTREKLNTLINLYLGDWITQQKRAVASGGSGNGADALLKLAKAEALKVKLEAILAGEKPYDLFVRWKPLHQQPLGWDPDLNDGVRMNIRPFVAAEILRIPRAKIGIKWEADRGKDVASAPWYPLGSTYGEPEGTRINDHHTSLAEKQAARANALTPGPSPDGRGEVYQEGKS